MAEGICQICRQAKSDVSETLGICLDCLQKDSFQAQQQIATAHARSRAPFNLPGSPPRNEDGIRCRICGNECQIKEGEYGFCGLRTVRKGRLVHLAGKPRNGLLQWTREPLPADCVANWVCEGDQHPEDDHLAIFYQSCSANCLSCQGWRFRESSPIKNQTISSTQLASKANRQTFCASFFGGDPSSQMAHAIDTARRLARRGVRICWETNGMMHPSLLDPALEISLETGGCMKFDLKAFDESVHRGLTGVSNERTMENFVHAAQRIQLRPRLPLVIASTPLVPGYIGVEQVTKIAGFIAAIDANIPYALISFSPSFQMIDLPASTLVQAQEAESVARQAGLKNVRIRNRHIFNATV